MRRMTGVMLVGVVLVGCSGGNSGDAKDSPVSSTRPHADGDPDESEDFDGFLADDGVSAIFLQWNERDGEVAGTVSVASLADDGQSVEHNSAAFEGFVDEEDVTLTFPRGLGLSKTWIGKLSGDVLAVTYNDAKGRLNELTLHAGTLSEFNASVAELESVADAGARGAAEIEADRTQADADANLARQIERARSSIITGLEDVRAALVNVEDSLKLVREDAAVEPMDTYQADSVQFSADSVGFARDGVGFELADVEKAFSDLQTIADPVAVEAMRPKLAEARSLMATAEKRVAEANGIAAEARRRAGG